MIVIVDCGIGNCHSVTKAISRYAPAISSSEPKMIAAADRLVIPGIGAFSECRAAITRFIPVLTAQKLRGVPILGLCVGMQLLGSYSEEGAGAEGFNWIPGRVVPLAPIERVPHMGWNDVMARRISWRGTAFFCHSYHFVPDDPQYLAAVTPHGGKIAAIIQKGNVLGVQFHPEKSQKYGLNFFADWVRS